MPFKSEAQRRFLWMKHPTIAKRWAKAYPGQKDLPMHVKEDGHEYYFDLGGNKGWGYMKAGSRDEALGKIKAQHNQEPIHIERKNKGMKTEGSAARWLQQFRDYGAVPAKELARRKAKAAKAAAKNAKVTAQVVAHESVNAQAQTERRTHVPCKGCGKMLGAASSSAEQGQLCRACREKKVKKEEVSESTQMAAYAAQITKDVAENIDAKYPIKKAHMCPDGRIGYRQPCPICARANQHGVPAGNKVSANAKPAMPATAKKYPAGYTYQYGKR